MTTRLEAYAALRQYVSRVPTIYAFGVWQYSARPFDIFATFERPWAHDQQLEEAARAAGIADLR